MNSKVFLFFFGLAVGVFSGFFFHRSNKMDVEFKNVEIDLLKAQIEKKRIEMNSLYLSIETLEDSLNNSFKTKIDSLDESYKNKMDNIANLNTDEHIKLFSELIASE